MQHHRILSREEWLPARRRRLSRERELMRQREQLTAERRRNEAGANFDLIGWLQHHDDYEGDCKRRTSTA